MCPSLDWGVTHTRCLVLAQSSHKCASWSGRCCCFRVVAVALCVCVLWRKGHCLVLEPSQDSHCYAHKWGVLLSPKPLTVPFGGSRMFHDPRQIPAEGCVEGIESTVLTVSTCQRGIMSWQLTPSSFADENAEAQWGLAPCPGSKDAW